MYWNGENNTKSLQYLNEDCLWLIIKQLPPIDLVHLGQTNWYFYHFVKPELRRERRIAKKAIVLAAPDHYHPDTYGDAYDYDYKEAENSIFVKNTVKVLNSYSHLIQNVYIIQCFHSEKVYHLIEDKLSDKISKLNLVSVHNFLELITKPFKNVKSVSLIDYSSDILMSQLNFSDLFPSMHKLLLKDIYLQNNSMILNNYPFLNDLFIAYETKISTINDDQIEQLIELNPQIKTLSMMFVSIESLRTIADKLPNLEEFELFGYNEQQFNDKNQNFHFENVKIFTTTNYINGFIRYYMPNSITFSEKLEEFTATMNFHDPQYIEFIENNPHLQRIHLIGEYFFTNDEILEITTIKLNVIVMTINCNHEVTTDTIVKFVGNNEQLIQLHLNVDLTQKIWIKRLIRFEHNTSMDIKQLRDVLENKWIINVTKKGISLRRKTYKQKN